MLLQVRLMQPQCYCSLQPSETNAATSETNAAASAAAALASQNAGSTSETNAATSAANAATSETNAAQVLRLQQLQRQTGQLLKQTLAATRQ